MHCLSRNGTKRHDLAIFASHFRGRVHAPNFFFKCHFESGLYQRDEDPHGMFVTLVPMSTSTPPCAGWFFDHSFRSALFTCTKRRVCVQTNNTKPPPSEFGGAVRRSRAITKKTCLFVRFFTYSAQPKYQNDAIFVNSEGLRPCLSKPSYGAPQWALIARLMQKERPKSPPPKAPFFK